MINTVRNFSQWEFSVSTNRNGRPGQTQGAIEEFTESFVLRDSVTIGIGRWVPKMGSLSLSVCVCVRFCCEVFLFVDREREREYTNIRVCEVFVVIGRRAGAYNPMVQCLPAYGSAFAA